MSVKAKKRASSSADIFQRRLPIGAEVQPGGGTHFRVWAPDHKQVVLALLGRDDHEVLEQVALRPEAEGYFSVHCPQAVDGSLYGFLLDDDPRPYADPASRFQPDGPHGPSQVIDPGTYTWSDGDWQGIRLPGQVLYEMHVGTFTPEGTWQAAAEQLQELARAGITVLEVMPVADFPGRFGWGYDGVNFFAPTRLYGTPNDFRRFVDRAHAVGLGVLLDVVYNHFGPDGNYLHRFSSNYVTDRYKNEWGPATNFDGPSSGPVREFFLSNVTYWIQEFHLDGFRLDATQDVQDSSEPHILAEVARRTREAAGGRGTLVVPENEPQDTRLIRPVEEGGWGMDTVWNDDFHRSATVALTGRNEAYYSDYLGRPQEFISSAKNGYLYQGQYYRWQKKPRGTSTRGLPREKFVHYLQNHDQIANSGRGLRVHCVAHPGSYRAMTALLLLGPQTPMLFQGQEFGASSPFYYFADHDDELSRKVHEGRKNFMAQFRSIAQPEVQAKLPDPADPATFMRCKLDVSERQKHAEIYRLHCDLLRLRRDDLVLSRQDCPLDGAVLGDDAFVLRFFDKECQDRILIVNLGRDLQVIPSPEPLLAPPPNRRWTLLWSSEDPCYGGSGTAPPVVDDNLYIQGHSAIVLHGVLREPNENSSAS